MQNLINEETQLLSWQQTMSRLRRSTALVVFIISRQSPISQNYSEFNLFSKDKKFLDKPFFLKRSFWSSFLLAKRVYGGLSTVASTVGCGPADGGSIPPDRTLYSKGGSKIILIKLFWRSQKRLFWSNFL